MLLTLLHGTNYARVPVPAVTGFAAPDFERIRREAGQETRDAANLTWQLLQEEIRQRKRGDAQLAPQGTQDWLVMIGDDD